MRGQSAIEYLMTYGWALLVLGIILALIYSSGIFSPAYLISEECNLGPKLPCSFIILTHSGQPDTVIDAQIGNGFGYTIYIDEINMKIENQGDMMTEKPQSDSPSKKLESGDALEVQTSLSNKKLAAGSTQRVIVNIKYYSCAPEVNPPCRRPSEEAIHEISGRIIGKVNAN